MKYQQVFCTFTINDFLRNLASFKSITPKPLSFILRTKKRLGLVTQLWVLENLEKSSEGVGGGGGSCTRPPTVWVLGGLALPQLAPVPPWFHLLCTRACPLLTFSHA